MVHHLIIELPRNSGDNEPFYQVQQIIWHYRDGTVERITRYGRTIITSISNLISISNWHYIRQNVQNITMQQCKRVYLRNIRNEIVFNEHQKTLVLNSCTITSRLPDTIEEMGLRGDTRIVNYPLSLKVLYLNDIPEDFEFPPELPHLEELTVKYRGNIPYIPPYPLLKKCKFIECQRFANIPIANTVEFVKCTIIPDIEEGIRRVVFVECKILPQLHPTIRWVEYYGCGKVTIPQHVTTTQQGYRSKFPSSITTILRRERCILNHLKIGKNITHVTLLNANEHNVTKEVVTQLANRYNLTLENSNFNNYFREENAKAFLTAFIQVKQQSFAQ